MAKARKPAIELSGYDISEARRRHARGKQLRGESPKHPWRIQMKREMAKDTEYGRRVRAKRAEGYTIYEDASMGKRKRRGKKA